MPTIGWIFVLVIIATVIGGLYMLRKTANKMPIGEEQMKRSRNVRRNSRLRSATRIADRVQCPCGLFL